MTEKSIDLWEVITNRKNGESPFGQTFHEQETASRYAREMRRAGYEADLSPWFCTAESAAFALHMAASVYDDADLKTRAINNETQK